MARLPILDEEVMCGLSPTQGPEQHWRGAESWATYEAGRQLPENTKNSARNSASKNGARKEVLVLVGNALSGRVATADKD